MDTTQQANIRNSVMELIHLIANLAHTEYHLCETLATNYENKSVKDSTIHALEANLHTVKEMRRKYMRNLMEQRPAVKGTWCIIKHLCLSMYHTYELYESTKHIEFLRDAQSINLLLDDILSHDEYKNLTSCGRCDTDSKVPSTEKTSQPMNLNPKKL